MTDKNQTEASPPAGSDEAQQDVAQASDAKAEATGTASDELSEDDLEAVAEMTSRRSQGGGLRFFWGRLRRPTDRLPKAEATGIACDELSEDDLEAVAGGKGCRNINCKVCGGKG
jgi:hypothetical protein